MERRAYLPTRYFASGSNSAQILWLQPQRRTSAYSRQHKNTRPGADRGGLRQYVGRLAPLVWAKSPPASVMIARRQNESEDPGRDDNAKRNPSAEITTGILVPFAVAGAGALLRTR